VCVRVFGGGGEVGRQSGRKHNTFCLGDSLNLAGETSAMFLRLFRATQGPTHRAHTPAHTQVCDCGK
jgi:hypothetical protein